MDRQNEADQMTDNHGKQPTTKPNTGRVIALGAILLGLLCIAAGIWLLNWTPKGASVAAAIAEPTTPLPAAPRHQTPAAQAVKPTHTVVPVATSTLPPDVKETPSERSEDPEHRVGPTPTATPVPIKSGPFHLAIVHSNDTWGYLMPCG
jgi:hypothetical protein